MTDPLDDFRIEYGTEFKAYMRKPDEAGLRSAYELGRRAFTEALSVLDMADAHHRALTSFVRDAGADGGAVLIADTAGSFFQEALSTFEMARRGFHEAQETARLEQEHAQQLRALADASLQINSTMSVDELVSLLTTRAKEIIGADRAVTVVPTNGDWTNAHVSVSHSGGSEEEPNEAVALAQMHAHLHDLREPMRMHRDAALESPWRELVERHGIREWLTVPLIDRSGGTLGLLQLFDKRDERFNETDESILVQLSQIAAVAMENAQLYQREHTIARTLQRSLLPERLPVVPGVELSARYMPGSAGVEVGGDWYDVIPLSGGRLGLVLGDVAGKGIRAASVMGQLRMALRAYALQDYSPAIVVARVDHFLQELDESYMATLVYLVLEADASKVSYVNAGHPPPLKVEADGLSSYLQTEESIPLGVVPNARYYQSMTRMDPGSTLLLYTDGLIEERGVALDIGLDRLRNSVRDAPSDLGEMCDFVLRSMVPDEPADDIALLTMQVTPLLQERFTLHLRAEPQTLPSLRRILRSWLERAGVPSEAAYEITSACSEACSNAIEHAYEVYGGEFDIEARITDDEVRIDVRDFGRWREEHPGDRGRGLTLMRALMDSVDVEPSSEGTTVSLRRRLEMAGGDAHAS